MMRKKELVLLLAFVILAVWIDSRSSFVDAADLKDQDKGNSNEKSTTADDSSEDSKERKSREDIMFGNQQKNRHGLFESLLQMKTNPDQKQIQENNNNNTHNAENNEEEEGSNKKMESSLKDESNEVVKKDQPEKANEGMDNENFNVDGAWYSKKDPMSGETLRYLLNNGPMNAIPEEDMTPVYDQDEVYRRKRQLAIPLALRKRSLRSPIGQMIQGRGRRLPRRSMRYKRQVDFDELLSILGNNEANNGGRYFSEQSPEEQNVVPHHSDSSFRHYPYGYGRNEPEMEQQETEEESEPQKEDLPNGLMFPPPRYYEPSDYPSSFSRMTKPDESDNPNIPYGEWMERSLSQPSIFTVNRRSTPLFYPLDYRYIPGYKKRSMMAKKEDANMGKWGRVVQSPNGYATAEDIARLYALANLLAEGENPDRDFGARRKGE